jgi:outer membrane biogenesis lipoprotein LolB
MKKQFLFFCLGAVSCLFLAGCATETTTTTQTTTDPTTTRVHTREELRKTGELETGAALEKTDAAITTSGPR